MKPSPLAPLLRMLGDALAAGGRRRWFALLAIAAMVALFLWRPELLQQERPPGSGQVARESPTGGQAADRERPAPSRPTTTATDPPPRDDGSGQFAPAGSDADSLAGSAQEPGTRGDTRLSRSPSSDARDPRDAWATAADSAGPPSSLSSRATSGGSPGAVREAAPARPAPRPQVTIPRGGEPYRSPAGLVYTRGSAQGHRLRHVLEHAEDVPDRPGSHGVFQSNDLTEIVALIDEAYERSRQGRGTQRREEEGRTVLTVDMGRDVGYIGGQSGNRRGRPRARQIRLVLQDSRVITAYPIVP